MFYKIYAATTGVKAPEQMPSVPGSYFKVTKKSSIIGYGKVDNLIPHTVRQWVSVEYRSTGTKWKVTY